MGRLYVFGPKEKIKPAVWVNTTSRSKDFGVAFSPFLNQGPIELGGLKSNNVENFWQFTKVYKEHVDDFAAWKKWRDSGLADTHAYRYPMGRGRQPEFSYFDKQKLGYVEARKRIYAPIFRQKLERYCQRQIHSLVDMLTVCDVWLWDFDGYLTEDSFETVINNPSNKMGHAFVLKKFIWDEYKVGGEF